MWEKTSWEKTKPWYDVSAEGLKKGAVEALPAVGGLIGGGIGAALGPFGVAAGSALGAAGGKAAENFIESQFMGEPKTRQQIYMDPVKEGLLDASMHGAGAVIGKGIGLAKGVVSPAKKSIIRHGAGNEFPEEILQESAERMGVRPTRGMISGDPFVQKTESAIAQSPTPTGARLNQELLAVGEGMKKTAEDVTFLGKSDLSPYQAGLEAKALIKKGVKKKLSPAVSIYKRIESELPLIDVSPQSSSRVAKNVMNLKYSKFKGTPSNNLASMVSENLGSIKTLEELRDLKSMVGKSTSDPAIASELRFTASEIYKRLSKMEQSTITRAAISSAKDSQQGRVMAKEMILDIQDANKIYSEVSNSLKKLGKDLGIGKVKNYSDFVRRIYDVPDEKFIEKVFKVNNISAMKSLKEEFPKAFVILRKTKMNSLYLKSRTPKGEISIPKLLNQVSHMHPEYKKMMFGGEVSQSLKDIKTVYGKTYDRVGPSGTPEGRSFMDYNPLNPIAWFQELRNRAQVHLMNNPKWLKKMTIKEGLRTAGPVTMKRGLVPMMSSAQGVGTVLRRSTLPRAFGVNSGLLNE